MTERQWRISADVHSMLRLVRGEPDDFLTLVRWRKQPSFRASERQLRLFAIACCRRIGHLIADQRLSRGIEAAEQYIDAPGPREELEAAAAGVELAYRETLELHHQAPHLSAAHEGLLDILSTGGDEPANREQTL